MDSKEFRGRSIDDALTQASIELGVTSDRLDYQVIEKGSAGFLGIGSKDALIRVSIKSDEAEANEPIKVAVEDVSGVDDPVTEVEPLIIEASEPVEFEMNKEPREQRASAPKRSTEDLKPVDREEVISRAREFLSSVFKAMELDVELVIDYEDQERMLSVEMNGPQMGIIIGKRGQTLDSLQYLTNLAVNRKLDSYIRVKMDTEDYRHRRKMTLENLAKNVAFKVKRSKKPVSLEPMNPYERRVIHYALQHDEYVKTESEGEEPYRHVVVSLTQSEKSPTSKR